MAKRNKYIFFLLSAFLLLLIPLQHFMKAAPIVSYTAIFTSASVLYLAAAVFIFKSEISHKQILIIALAAFLIKLSFVASPVTGSDDIYRYMWDGKIQSNGINPYLYAPDDSRLAPYHSDLLPKALNFKEMKTIYFPLSQWLFYTGYKLGGESVWGYKLLLLIFELLTIWSIILLLKKTDTDLKYSLLYILAPLPFFEFAIDAHLDGFGLPLLLFSIYFFIDKKYLFSAFFLGLSLSIKPVGLLLAPVYLLSQKTNTERMKFIFTAAVSFFIQFVFYISNTNPFESFFIFTKNWFFNGFVFNLLNSVVHNNQTSRLICAAFLILSLLPVYFSKKEFTDKIYFSVLLLMIFSPVVHPWYIAWVLILVPLSKKWSGIYFTAMASLTAFTVLNYQLYGIWKDYWIVLFIEYLPTLILLIYELKGAGFNFKPFRNN